MNVAVLTEIVAAVVSYFFVFPEYGLFWAVVAFALVNLCGFVGFLSFALATMEEGSRLGAVILGLVFLLSIYFGGGFVLDLDTNRFPEHGLIVSRSGWRHRGFEGDQLGMEVIAYYERGNSKLLLFLDENFLESLPDPTTASDVERVVSGGFRKIGAESAYWSIRRQQRRLDRFELHVWVPRHGRPVLSLLLIYSPHEGDALRDFWRLVDRIEFTSDGDA